MSTPVKERFQCRIPISKQAYDEWGAENWNDTAIKMCEKYMKEMGYDWGPIEFVRREDYAWFGMGDDSVQQPVGPLALANQDVEPDSYVFVYEAMGVRHDTANITD